MLKKIGLVAVLAALVSVVVATTTAWGSAKTSRTAAAATATVKCGTKVSIGVAYPATGGVAFLGALQFDWAKTALKRWNGSHKLKIKFVQGDTKLTTDAAANVAVAHSFASNGKVLAVTGPAGSQEVQDSSGVYHGAGLAPVSGSATRIFLTRAKTVNGKTTARETSKGFFYRTVPNDGQQGDAVANFIHKDLKKKRIYVIDDEEAYSQGLADQVQADLKKFGINSTRNHVAQNVSDFSSLIAAIPNNTQLVYIPWQQAAEAQTFASQLHANGKNAIVMGSDGIDAPGQFTTSGSYVSGFPVDAANPVYKAFTKAHKGQPEAFGLPTYTSVWANATAIKMACKAGHGKTTRKAVRKALLKVKLSAKQSLLGFPVQFLNKNKGTFQGPGDMGGTADFAIYKINKNGSYTRVK
jgi:branched-chain amino acid transport system substrate-binding protein